MVELATELRWQDHRLEIPMERILLSEKLGYDAVFTPEGYATECLVTAGYIAAHTKRLKVGTRILQVTGRAPSIAAASFQTLNHLTGGNRVIAGLGSGTPITSEGREGRAWGNPVKRMRDYVTLLRQGLAGQPLNHQGTEWSSPYRGPGAQNLGPLPASALEVLSPIPIMLASAHPQMTALTAEIADGWFPPAWAPGIMKTFKPILEKGFARAGGGKSFKDFKIWVQVDMMVDKDVRKAMRPFKEYTVTMAHLQKEFMEARGYGGLSERLTELFPPDLVEKQVMSGQSVLSGKQWEEAINTVPDDYIDEGWLVGPVERIKDRAKLWFDSGLTGMIMRYGPPMFHDRVIEPLEVFTAIAQAAGKAPASVG